jgi:predicted amidohydrolase
MVTKVAAIQFEPELGECGRNLERLLRMNREAAGAGARLIVNPEMAVSGYCFFDREEIAPYVEPIPGPTSRALGDVARAYGCIIVCGIAEVEAASGLYYNSAVVVGPEGLIGAYRKVHHFVSDTTWSVEGDLGFPVWETAVGRIGVEICQDAAFPESGRLLALNGAQVICFPTNWLGDDGCPAQKWISQAYENGVYLIAADRWGVERGVHFKGGSCIVTPEGAVQRFVRHGDAIVYGEIDPHGDHRFGCGPEDKLGDRRPALYREMLQNTYSWGGEHVHRLYGSPGLPAPTASRIGVLQMAPDSGDEGCRVEAISRAAQSQPLDLLVLPDLALCCEPPGKSGRDGLRDLPALERLSRDLATLIVTSTVEEAGRRLYKTVVLVGANGLIAAQRAMHLTRADLSWATAGNGPLRTVDTPVGRLGLLAGYDALFFETVRVLAAKGADLICIPSALPWPKRLRIGAGCEWSYWRTMGWTGYVALAVANYASPEYAGNSTVAVPAIDDEDDMEASAGEDEEALLVLTLDTGSRYIREKRGLVWRRLSEYRSLTVARQ